MGSPRGNEKQQKKTQYVQAPGPSLKNGNGEGGVGGGGVGGGWGGGGGGWPAAVGIHSNLVRSYLRIKTQRKSRYVTRQTKEGGVRFGKTFLTANGGGSKRFRRGKKASLEGGKQGSLELVLPEAANAQDAKRARRRGAAGDSGGGTGMNGKKREDPTRGGFVKMGKGVEGVITKGGGNKKKCERIEWGQVWKPGKNC